MTRHVSLKWRLMRPAQGNPKQQWQQIMSSAVDKLAHLHNLCPLKFCTQFHKCLWHHGTTQCWWLSLLTYTAGFFLTGYLGLILRSTPVAAASHSTVEGTMRVLCSYCMRSSLSAFCHSSISILSSSSTVLQLEFVSAVILVLACVNMQPVFALPWIWGTAKNEQYKPQIC